MELTKETLEKHLGVEVTETPIDDFADQVVSYNTPEFRAKKPGIRVDIIDQTRRLASYDGEGVYDRISNWEMQIYTRQNNKPGSRLSLQRFVPFYTNEEERSDREQHHKRWHPDKEFNLPHFDEALVEVSKFFREFVLPKLEPPKPEPPIRVDQAKFVDSALEASDLMQGFVDLMVDQLSKLGPRELRAVLKEVKTREPDDCQEAMALAGLTHLIKESTK